MTYQKCANCTDDRCLVGIEPRSPPMVMVPVYAGLTHVLRDPPMVQFTPKCLVCGCERPKIIEEPRHTESAVPK